LQASIAQERARITEIRQQSIQLDQDARTEAGKELAEVTARLAEQEVRKVSAGDMNQRTLIRAPYDGIVDKLAYTTIGGVIPPAETIVEIVPDSDRFTVDAKVSPADIDQLRINQPATLHFSAFNRQTTPQLTGALSHVSAERAVDERSGGSYYTVRITVNEDELRKLGGLKLVPGMPVEAYIMTGNRSLLSYLTKPLRDQLSRAFREN
jgi:HlyD family type I secretion membrane fusion protein